ncbi:putative indolepyruvate ferredoxin oxidoreductase beta subunit [Clostridium sp. CAG:413]|nr:indolepyruvate oxidoreductase subunit beta [Clostridium sp.]CDC11191.1 putative indolepyruvate ferredoxin oxidoreductase beta subunit [Clostridium sp. CAG:413]
MQNTKNIMIVGVGGQGTLLASRILGNAVISEGYDVKVSEVHGMSQRGGSVVTYVKYGDKVFSPIIDRGEADMILAFEKLEAARALPYLKEGGTVILNDREIAPMPVITGAAEYPDGLVADIAAKAKVIAIDALSLSLKAGSAKAVNVVLIGVLARSSDISKEVWIQTIKDTVPAKFLDLNLKAFELGYNCGC